MSIKSADSASAVHAFFTGAEDKAVKKWKSSNKKVATVSNGVVTFKKKGKVTITATATRGKKKAKVRFKVSK